MREWTRVAQVIKPKNLQGCLVLRSGAGLPFLLEEGMEVAFVPPQIDCPRRSKVLSITEYKTQDYLVFFEEVTDIDTAEKLSGGYCLVRTAHLPENWESLQEDTIVGYHIVDEKFGELGAVIDSVELPLQSHILVQGPFGTIVIPLVEEYVVEINDDDRVITTRVSQGILDLGSGVSSDAIADESTVSQGNTSLQATDIISGEQE